jgi:hypothetical protein
MSGPARAGVASLVAGTVIAIFLAVFSEANLSGALWETPLFYGADVLALVLGVVVGLRFPANRTMTIVAGVFPMAVLGLAGYVLGLPSGRPEASWYYLLMVVCALYGAMIAIISGQRQDEMNASQDETNAI